jgi:hypothetical protein
VWVSSSFVFSGYDDASSRRVCSALNSIDIYYIHRRVWRQGGRGRGRRGRRTTMKGGGAVGRVFFGAFLGRHWARWRGITRCAVWCGVVCWVCVSVCLCVCVSVWCAVLCLGGVVVVVVVVVVVLGGGFGYGQTQHRLSTPSLSGRSHKHANVHTYTWIHTACSLCT